MTGHTAAQTEDPVTRVCVLGAVTATRASGAVVEFGSASQRRLVAVLAVHAGRTVRASSLGDILGLTPGALRTSMSRLRRLVGDDAVTSDPLGYRLVVDTDAAQFARDLEARDDDPLDRVGRALARWSGPALDEFSDETWAMPEVARLEELRGAAIETRAGELLARGLGGEAVAELEALVAAHPLRDRAQGLLMRAFAAEGRQSEALARYQAYRAHLVEVGSEPSLDVRQLERRIAGAWYTVAAELPEVRALHFPRSTASFLARGSELAAIAEHLADSRMLTLTGEGGVGKTRLATEAATRGTGPWTSATFVDLSVVGDATDVVATVAARFGMPAVHGLTSVVQWLAEQPVLVVLDNCEHVLDAAAAVAEGLVAQCPNVAVLATSREPLGVDVERVLRVWPLDPAGAAAELFVQRARAAGATLEPAQRATVETICRRLDGNPLAIELTARRVPSLGLDNVREGLDDRFALLAGVRRRGTDRHQTLRAVVDWSYRLLTDNEQRLFRFLGVFTGGFELDAVRTTWNMLGRDDSGVAAMLAMLVDRSMVEAAPRPASTRFRLLDTLRAFALDELVRHGEAAAVADAHADWVATLAGGSLDEWMDAHVHQQVVRLERDPDNWRDAVAHVVSRGDRPRARRLCGTGSALLVWGRPDLLEPVERLAAAVGDGPGDTEARDIAAVAAWGAAYARLDLDGMRAAVERLGRDGMPASSGTRAVVQSVGQLLGGELRGATVTRAQALADPQLVAGGRDYLVGLTVYAAFSGGAGDLADPRWIEQVREVADRSSVPMLRSIAGVAAAWALAGTDPEAAFERVQQVMADVEPMPATFRHLVDSFLGRFMISQSPALGARQLLAHSLLGPADAVYGVALVTAAGLLAACGHPRASDVVATVTPKLSSTYVRNFVPNLADHQARGTVLEPEVLLATMRAALEEIAASAAPASRGDARL